MAQTAQINISVNATAGTKSVQDLSNSINQAGGSASSLRAELRKVTMELQGLEPGSARFAELSARAGQLRDQIADTSAVIQATAGNAVERFGTALGNTVQLGVAGFQALSAAQALFGTENEEVNKSIQKMTALLNLTQAIQTFGGLGDKITEIRAGFGLLATQQTATAVATTEAAVAMEGQAVAATADAVATEGATVATSAFGVALNALPLVGIIAALGFAVSALISYSSASDEAKKEEEKRKKAIEDSKKAQDEETASVVASSKEYVGLIYQIKNTTAGTKERKKAIDEVNKTYGTTLKNLADEFAFQEQLNTSVRNYISLQVIKVRQEKNVAKIAELLDKQAIASAELAKAEAKRDQQAKESNLTAKQVYDNFDYIRLSIDKALNSVNQYQFQIDSLTLTSEQLAKEEIKLQQAFNNGNTGLKTRTTTTKETTDALKDYESILNKIRATEEDNKKAEEEIFKKRAENFDKTVNLVEVEQKTREQAAIDEYNAVKIAIDKELTARKIKSEEKKRLLELEKLNEANLTKTLQIENEKRLLDIKIQTFKILEENRLRIEALKKEQIALNDEIRFGDGNTTDTKIALFQRERLAYIQEIDSKLLRSKYANQVELDEFEKLQKDRLQILLINLNEEKLNREKIAQAEYDRQLQLETDRIQAQQDLRVKYYTDEYGAQRARVEITNEAVNDIIKLSEDERKAKSDQLSKASDDLQKQIDKEVDVSKKGDLMKQKNSTDAALATYEQNVQLAVDLSEIRVKTEENLNTTIVNLDAEKNTKIVEANAQLNADIKAETIKTEDEILDEKIKRLDEYLAFAQEQFQKASSLISQFAKQQQEIRTTQLEDAIAFDKERIESQYAANLISREQYDNAIEQLNQKQQQEQLQIDRKNFRTEKALNIAGATIDGARAVLGAFAGTPGGIVIKTIAAALAGVFAATQIALIARQEFKAADGGIVPGDGSGEIDSVPARLAPGEAVINSQSTQAFLPLLSAINEAGGGQSFVPDLPAVNAPQTFAPVFADNQRREPIRAYVVETDITDAQKRVSRIERSTRF
jgi:hypothetical protein